MREDKVIRFEKPGTAKDALTLLLRARAKKLLNEVAEAEAESLLVHYSELRDEGGDQQVVGIGSFTLRKVEIGIGAVEVKSRRVEGCRGTGIRLASSTFPPDLRRTQSLGALIPCLNLRGISAGDFADALTPLGAGVPRLSPGRESQL